MAELKIDWASYKSAKYAVEHWHYSKVLPVGKLVKVGVWEDRRFIGVVLFGRGASKDLGKKFGINGPAEVCELVRVALKSHKTEVTKIISIAIKFYKLKNPKTKLIISFADQMQNHLGIIYQAGNWIYVGTSAVTTQYFIDGRWKHTRSVGLKYNIGKTDFDALGIPRRKAPPKHQYLMPLTKQLRKSILKLAKPYPKCPDSVDSCTLSDQDKSGGAKPTSGLKS